MESFDGDSRNPIYDNREECPDCGGDGRETCNNPDHGLIADMGGETSRLGCPVCGHNENHKVINGGNCETCDGTGLIEPKEKHNLTNETL